MEFAQSLVLTNALGGLSSLGRASYSTAPHGGMLLELTNWAVEIVCREGRVDVYLFDAMEQPLIAAESSPSDLDSWSLLNAFTPARVLLMNESQVTTVVPLEIHRDHLEAALRLPDTPCYLAVALSAQGQTHCTRPILLPSSPLNVQR